MGLKLAAHLILLVSLCSGSVASDKYILPWTSPSVRGKAVSCWGRTYDYGASLLPVKMISQDENILAGPVELQAAVAGQRVSWGKSSFKVLKTDAQTAQYVTSASANRALAECTLTTEFDGTTRVDVKLSTESEIMLDSLDLVIPLKSRWAGYFHHASVYPVHVWDWPKKQMNAGAVKPEGLKLPFVFHLWLGNDERGLQFFSESDESWSPADPKTCVTVTPSGDVTTLRMNLLSSYKLSGTWKWTFGFIATPVKPFTPGFRRIHYCHMGAYGEEKNQYSGKPADKDHPSYLDVMDSMGVNYLGFHESWSDEQSLPRPKRVEELKSLLQACRGKGIGLVPYTGCYMSTRSPEYQKDWDSLPIGDHYQYQRSDNKDVCRIVCNNTGYPDLLVRTYTQAFKEYGFGGLYMDGLSVPLPCTNTKHGCGYTGRDGQVHPTMAIWRTREAMKALYRLVKTQPKPGIIVSHTSASVLLPALSFADFGLDGEHLLSMMKIGTPEYSEDILRAQMCGNNFGIPAMQLPSGSGKAQREYARTWCLLYDIMWMWHPDHQVDIWKAFDSFGMAGTKWIPYWKTSGLVSLSDEDNFKVSAYLKKGRGALFVVANLGDKAAATILKANRTGMGLSSNYRLLTRNEVSGGLSVLMPGDQVSVTVMPGAFKMISIIADETGGPTW